MHRRTVVLLAALLFSLAVLLLPESASSWLSAVTVRALPDPHAAYGPQEVAAPSLQPAGAPSLEAASGGAILVGAPKPLPPSEPLPPGGGAIDPPMDLSHLKGDRMPEGMTEAELPARFDWRETGKVSAVENQGSCASCYAFAGLGSFESGLLISNQGLYNFSQNNAKECEWFAFNETGRSAGELLGSCNGGFSFMVASYLAQRGAVLETCDPYAASNVACKSGCTPVKVLSEWRLISGRTVPSPSVLKGYLKRYGPLYVSMYAGSSNSSGCTDDWCREFGGYDGSKVLYHPGTENTNHGVLVVGWDDDLQHAGGRGAWIVRNSWGTQWGGPCGYGSGKGFFYIAYGSASIGKNAAVFNGGRNYDPRGGLLFYDEAGWLNSYGYGSTTGWGLVKFFAPRNTRVTHVEFWTTDVTTDVDVYLYNGFDGSRRGTLLWSRENLSYTDSGYFSVVVQPAVAVAQGSQVVAVVKFTNSTDKYPIPQDYRGPHETGRTYVSGTGANGDWKDLGTGQYPGDVAIRVRYSDGSPGPTATPTATTRPPTHTPTATTRPGSTNTPTATTRPGATNTPTRTRPPGETSRILLPIVLKQHRGPGPARTVTPGQGGPDAFGYTWTRQTGYEWIWTGNGDDIPGGDDNYRGPYPVGFTFRFYGTARTQFWINTNGLVLFDGNGSGARAQYENTFLPSAAAPSNMAAAFWDDLKPMSGAAIRYKTFGTAPNRYLVVEWNNVGHYSDFDHGMTFQAIFYEGSNDIKFQYKTMEVNSRGDGEEASVGIENANGTVGLGVSFNEKWITNGSAVRFFCPH